MPHESYCRALRVLLPSEYKIATPQYSYLFTLAHPLWYVIAFIQFDMNGRDKSVPTPTECMLRIIHAYQRLPTCTHCRDPIYRARILRNTRCELFTYTNIYPRTPTVRADLSCPHITEYMLWVFLSFINFVFHLCHSICALMIFFFRSVAPTHVATTHWIKID